MEYRDMLFDVSDHVATITLNRPERLNAISGGMLASFSDALRAPTATAMCGRSSSPAPAAASARGSTSRSRASAARRTASTAPTSPRAPRASTSRRARRSSSIRPKAGDLRAQRRRCRLRHGPRARLRHPHRLRAREARRHLHEARRPAGKRRRLAAAAAHRLVEGRRDRVPRQGARRAGVPRTRPRQPRRARRHPDGRSARDGGRDRPQRAARRAGDEAHDAPRARRDVEANVHHVYLQLLPLFGSRDFKEGVQASSSAASPRRRTIRDRRSRAGVDEQRIGGCEERKTILHPPIFRSSRRLPIMSSRRDAAYGAAMIRLALRRARTHSPAPSSRAAAARRR